MNNKIILALCIFLTTACSQEPTSPSAVTTDASPPFPSLFQSVELESEAAPIPVVRKQVSPGDEVVIEAKVMGSKSPFVEGRALMVVGDEGTITSCDLMSDDDHCETPWDACCDSREGLREGTATVQVVDDAGKVLTQGFRGVNGLKELSRVRVKGKVAPMSTEQAFVINATAIEVLP